MNGSGRRNSIGLVLASTAALVLSLTLAAPALAVDHRAGGSDHDKVTHDRTQAATQGEAHSQAQQKARPQGQQKAQQKERDKAGTHAVAGTGGTTGDVQQPQPVSSADENPGGANGQCPGGAYCSTRDGSPSANGVGAGKATGKPCAGCVGRADNKNPRGQRPNGSDHNAGYECDGNQGIGQTNPAHTGCRAEETPGGETPGGENPGSPGTPPCVGNPSTPGCTQVLPPVLTPVPPIVNRAIVSPPPVNRAAPPVGDRIAPRSAAQVLPQTGIPGGLVAELLAAAALLSGGLLLVRRRRTPREDQG